MYDVCVIYIKNMYTHIIHTYPIIYWALLVAQMVKNPPAMQETWVQPLGREDPLKKAWQPTPVFLPGESPWTEEPGGPQSMRSQRVRHD